jgi:hypothetical protein
MRSELPTKYQRKQLAENKRRTGMLMPEGMTYVLAKQIIDSSPVFSRERRERRARERPTPTARRLRGPRAGRSSPIE